MKTYTITRKQLVELDACRPMLLVFDELYPSGTATIEWTQENQILLLKGLLRCWIGWASGQGLLPRLDLRGLDLRHAYLSGADLSGADLSGANLSGANLSGADLRNADLSGAVLRRAVLRRADLRRAVLRGADLSGAVLRLAYLPENWQDAVAFGP